jgi:hypothetical protein
MHVHTGEKAQRGLYDDADIRIVVDAQNRSALACRRDS